MNETSQGAHNLTEAAELRDRSGELGAITGDKHASELQQAKKRFEYLLAVSPAIIYTTKASGSFDCTYVSENIRDIMGFSPQEMTTDAKCWPDRLHPDDASRVFAELGPLIAAGGGSVEYRFRHRDGRYVWIQDTFKVIYDEDPSGSEQVPEEKRRPLELVGAWADITKRKEAEQGALDSAALLQDTKRSLARLIESSPDAIISTDSDGTITLFNEGAEALLGYRSDEVIGHSVSILYGGDAGANEVLREMRKRGGTVSGFDSVLWGKDGVAIPVLISASVLFDDEGREIGTVGFATDLRDRKRAQEALQKSYDELEKRVEERTQELKEARGRLQYLLTVTPGIMYTNQVANGYACTFVSRNVDPIMGFSEWEMIEDPEFWAKRLHPEDAARVFDEMTPLVKQGGGTLEYRFRHRDGHYVWIQDTFRVIANSEGDPIELVGSWADITHRKEVEHALGERMALMNDLQNLVAASPAVIYTTKASDDYACTFVSENLKSTMGYAPWEMREDPKFWSKRLHPEDAHRVLQEIADAVDAGQGTLEYRFRHRRGHYLWIQDSFKVMFNRDGTPRELVGSWADISDRKAIEAELQRVAGEVEIRNRFIRETFGRYLSDEIVANLLESPAGLKIGGEKRKITMLIADLRGFTSLSERLSPKWVVSLLNSYLTQMTAVIKRHEGTIDEIMGDAIVVLFGAPVWREDDAQRAAACALEMQLAMTELNARNQIDGLPALEMGVGLHTGQVVVGNIGSPERMKYGIVGSHINLTSRIQSYTVGGQIFASEATRREIGPMLKIGKQLEIRAKGIEQPVAICEVVGIGGPYKLNLLQSREVLSVLGAVVPFVYTTVDGTQVNSVPRSGAFFKLSLKQAEARFDEQLAPLTNLMLHLIDPGGHEMRSALYCKVTEVRPSDSHVATVRFTSIAPEAEEVLRALIGAPGSLSCEMPGDGTLLN